VPFARKGRSLEVEEAPFACKGTGLEVEVRVFARKGQGLEVALLPVAGKRRLASEEILRSSDDGCLHAVNRRERVEQAFPFLATVAAHPELAGGDAKVEGG
jgi:hypothetical protein